ncbi:MAG: hypothetical protein ACREFY_15535 [Acetobacteraceae bacterium]
MSVGLAVIYSLLHLGWQRVKTIRPRRTPRHNPAPAGMGGMR